MTKDTAVSLATQFHIELGRNFFTLPSSEVGKVLEAADHVKYRKPRNANGSRGRYFYEALNRAVRRKEAAYQPKTGAKCGCRRGQQRDNCPQCEGTGWIIDFAAIRARHA